MTINSDKASYSGLSSARELLRLLTDRFPPPEGQHHGLMLRDDDNRGLDLMLRVEGGGQLVHLDKEDLDKIPNELFQMITELVQ